MCIKYMCHFQQLVNHTSDDSSTALPPNQSATITPINRLMEFNQCGYKLFTHAMWNPTDTFLFKIHDVQCNKKRHRITIKIKKKNIHKI